jgi:cyclopropane fatty-acyl-phospholipid synthase-like methyltransferase
VVRIDIVRTLLGPRPGRRILDLGCGDGRVSLQFIDQAEHVTLVDSSKAMLEAAAARVPDHLRHRVTLVQSDLASFSPDEPFDVVLCLGVLAHVSVVEDALRQLASHVRPGGVAVIQITDGESWHGRIALGWARWRARVGAAHSYLPSQSKLTELLMTLKKLRLRPAGIRRCSFVLPGMGRLSNRSLLAYERFMQAKSWLAPLAADAIVLARRDRP